MAGGLLLTPLFVFLTPAPLRGVTAGAWVASVLWFVGLVVVLFTGSAAQIMGGAAERWTSRELLWLKRRGWRSFDAVRLEKYGDVDHVAVGPAGAVVLETKWRSGDWDLSDEMAGPTRIGEAQLVKRQRQVRLWLKPVIADAPVHALLVAWGAEGETELQLASGVVVVPGERLRQYLEEMPGDALSLDSVNEAARKLESHIATRQAADDASGRKLIRPFGDVLTDIGLGALCGLGGAFAAAWAIVGAITWPAWAGPAALVLVVATWFVRRNRWVTTFVVGFAAGLLITLGWVGLKLVVG